jgi:two-component system, cell cycle response regulator
MEHSENRVLSDSATGIANQRAFSQRLEYELNRAKRYKRTLSLMVMSIDDFHTLVPIYGNSSADDVIKLAVAIVQQCVRNTDIPARLIRDRIAIIFPETTSATAMLVAERIREKLSADSIREDIPDLRVTASIGLVSFPSHAREENDLMAKALEFLEEAIKQGGNNVYNG